MIKKFSKYLSDYFIKIGIVERKNKSWCQYVIEKKTIRLIFGMTALIFSLYIKRPLVTVLFLIIFCSIRRHIGGWHASSPWKCLTLSSVMLLLITVFLEPFVERVPPIITLILNAVLFANLLHCSPLYPQYVHFGENEKNANNQKKKVVVYIIWFFNMIFCECPIVLSCTFWSVLSTVVLLPFGPTNPPAWLCVAVGPENPPCCAARTGAEHSAITATIAANFFIVMSPFHVGLRLLNKLILNKFLRQKKILFLLYRGCSHKVY